MRAKRNAVVLLLAIAVIAAAVRAQGEDLERIVVTGTRLERRDFVSASPIVSLSEDLFTRTGSSTVETTINTLPQFVPAYTGTSNNPYNGGQANVQLRGLGSASTLVLVDGKRLIPANGTGVVDLNVIPGTLVDSVEIITGGASAVYGSEAIAGVVNFRLKNHFDAVQLDAQWGQTSRDDGAEYGGGVTAGIGFGQGRGAVLAYVGYAQRDAVLCAQRDFTQFTLGYVGPGEGSVGPGNSFVPVGSAVIEEGRIAPLEPSMAAFANLFESYGYPAGSVPNQDNFAVNADGSVFAGGNGDPGSVLNFRGERDAAFNDRFYAYNFLPTNYLRLPLERASAFARASFEVSEAAEIYAQGLYADYTVDLQHAPTPADGLRAPATNPYIPADLQLLLDSRPDPAADFDFHKRLSQLGPRVASFQYDVYQVTAGVRGRVRADWHYDFYGQVGANDQTETQYGNALRSHVEDLTFAPDGGRSICGGFDPFAVNGLTEKCAAYIAVEASNRAGVDQSIIEASVTGPLLALPAGELQAAFGLFYKRDEYHYAADPIAAVFLPDRPLPDIAGFNASDDIDGDDSNLDLYVEASVPLLADRPGVRALELVTGFRHSDYESAGGADSYKFELLYQPVAPLRLRGSFQHAVRAPSIYELYLPQLPASFGNPSGIDLPIDPCEASSAERAGPDGQQVLELCLAQGFPPGELADYTDPLHDALGFIGGNPDLDPEQADTLTAGVVLHSPSAQGWLERLQVSLDWYDIEVEGAITTIFADQFIARCFDRTFNPDFDAGNSWCGMFSRDPATGEIVDAYEIMRNSAGLRTSGVDLQLDWNLDVGPGHLGVNWLVSYVDSFERLEAAGIPSTDFAGTIGSDFVGTSFPQWKWSLGVTYAWRAVTLDGRWRYVGAMRDADPSLDPEFRIPHYDYFDVGASFDFDDGRLDGLQLRVGIENLADEDPPVFPSNSGPNTDASQFDVLGRRYYLNLSYAF